MKKLYTILAATLMTTAVVNAKTYTLGSGKWTEAATWNGEYAGTTIKADDVVVITGQVTMNTAIVVEGTLQVDKGASMIGMKDLVVTKTGTFTNNGNTVMKRILNEGTINNNLIMEAMMDVENKGNVQNNNNIVAGNNLQNYGGNAAGNGGAYYVNNNIVTSPASKFGTDVKVFYGNMMDNQTASNGTNLNLYAAVNTNAVELNVSNPSKVDVSLFSIEKSTDGKNFTLLEMITNVNSNNDVAMSYTDTKVNSNITYYRVKAISANGQETVLPVATVKAPINNAFSMAE